MGFGVRESEFQAETPKIQPLAEPRPYPQSPRLRYEDSHSTAGGRWEMKQARSEVGREAAAFASLGAVALSSELPAPPSACTSPFGARGCSRLLPGRQKAQAIGQSGLPPVYSPGDALVATAGTSCPPLPVPVLGPSCV